MELTTGRASSMAVAVALVGVVGLAAGCRHEQAYQPSPTPVRVSAVGIYQGSAGVTYSANILPYSQVTLGFKSGGYVQSILQLKGADGRMRDVQEGDWVERDVVLAQVRTRDYENQASAAKGQLAQAQAGLEDAKLNYDRATALYASQSLTKPDLDVAKAKYDSSVALVASAQAQLAQAQLALEDCDVRAPLSGWVLSRNVEVGSLVGPSSPGFTLADLHLVKAVFGVPDTAVKSVELGATQTLTTESVPGEFQGRITAISPAADPKSRVFSVEVTIPNPRGVLRAGMVATLKTGGSKPAAPVTVIPLSAVVRSIHDPSKFAAFVVEDQGGMSVARSRDIQVGETYGNQVSVTQGLSVGEQVISVGATITKDGEQVQVMP
ncbi:MAG: efflux RND transporter periplasmic adaptor subunit [Terriglobia bacterium]|jgi:multidrug efflux system membrane fusion protein